MKSIKNNLKQIPLILSIIFFIFSCVVFLLLYKGIKNKNQTSQEAQISWQQEEYKKSNIKSLETLVKETQDEQVSIEKHFVHSSDIVPFLDTIENLAPLAGVTVEVASVDLPKDNTGLAISLSSNGTFGATYKFINLLENGPYRLDITSMDISENGQDEHLVPQWQGNFKVKVLSFLP